MHYIVVFFLFFFLISFVDRYDKFMQRQSECFLLKFEFLSLFAVMCKCGQLVALAHEASFFVSRFHEGQRGISQEME